MAARYSVFFRGFLPLNVALIAQSFGYAAGATLLPMQVIVPVVFVATAISVPFEVVAKNYILMSDQTDKFNSQLAKLAKNKAEAKAFAARFPSKAPTVKETFAMIRDHPHSRGRYQNFYPGFWCTFGANYLSSSVSLFFFQMTMNYQFVRRKD